jgi:CSLREA domain-containing protein
MQTTTANRSLAAVSLTLAFASASANTITVNTIQDTNNSGFCSLRDAIDNANNNSQTHGDCTSGGGADTIVFDTTVFATAQTILLGSTLPNLSDSSTTTIEGAGKVTLDGQNQFEIMSVGLFVPNVSAELRNITLSHGNAPGGSTSQYYGGAIYDAGTLVARNVTFANNNATFGGGALFTVPSDVTLIDCTFIGNTDANGSGGAIYNQGTLTIRNSTFSGNTTGNFGGGLFQGSGQTTILNSTFSDNTAYNGSAIRINGGDVSVSNSTIAGNTLSNFGGSLSNSNSSGPFTVTNSIVANNSNGNCNGTIIDGSGNLRWPSTDSSCPGAVGDPKLGALGDNGGLTKTLLPGTGSAAIDAIACTNAPPADQRGMIRPDPGSVSATPCDIGAVEANSIYDEIFRNGFE